MEALANALLGASVPLIKLVVEKTSDQDFMTALTLASNFALSHLTWRHLVRVRWAEIARDRPRIYTMFVSPTLYADISSTKEQ